MKSPTPAAEARGVFRAGQEREGAFLHRQLAPPTELAKFVQHFWFVQWDLRGMPPRVAETLPHPNCHLVFEHDLEQGVDHPCVERRAEVAGVATGKFSRNLQGHGRVFGIKFQPGGLRPFFSSPVSELTDLVVPAADVFGPDILGLARSLRLLDSVESMAAEATRYFTQRALGCDPNSELATALVTTILRDSTMLSVEALSKRSGLGVRSLQRLFRDYVGVSPKWVIRRFRLHELMERLHSGQPMDGVQLALDLGYADQAHMINDFRKLAGCTPSEYKRRCEQRA